MSETAGPSDRVERGADRRRKPTNPLSLSSLFGSRRSFRRAQDRELHYYVDRYGSKSVAVLLAAVLLSTLDALITLHLVSVGGEEINPLMDFLLGLGPAPFLAIKFAITGTSLLVLLVHKEYRWVGGRLRVKYVMAGVLFAYLLLLAWEIFLYVRL